MSSSDKENESISHIILCCVAGKGVSALIRPSRSYVNVGMHFNFFVHGALGFYTSQRVTTDPAFKSALDISLKATRCLAVPFLMADLYPNLELSNPDANAILSKDVINVLHVLSGVIPFAISVLDVKSSHEKMVTFCLAANILTLMYQALRRLSGSEWYTTGAAVVAYFVIKPDDKLKYPLALAVLEYWSYRVSGLVRGLRFV